MHSMNQRADVSNSLATGLGLGFASESLSCINDTIHQWNCHTTSPMVFLITAVNMVVFVSSLRCREWSYDVLACILPGLWDCRQVDKQLFNWNWNMSNPSRSPTYFCCMMDIQRTNTTTNWYWIDVLATGSRRLYNRQNTRSTPDITASGRKS